MTVKDLLEQEKDSLLSKAKEYVSKKYPEKEMAREFDDEVLNWVNDDWEEEGYSDEYEWYDNYGKGEAEDAVIQNIITEVENELKKKFSGDEEFEFEQWLRDKYYFLNR